MIGKRKSVSVYKCTLYMKHYIEFICCILNIFQVTLDLYALCALHFPIGFEGIVPNAFECGEFYWNKLQKTGGFHSYRIKHLKHRHHAVVQSYIAPYKAPVDCKCILQAPPCINDDELNTLSACSSFRRKHHSPQHNYPPWRRRELKQSYTRALIKCTQLCQLGLRRKGHKSEIDLLSSGTNHPSPPGSTGPVVLLLFFFKSDAA